MGDRFTTSMAIPLDGDGFLRRECPTCERELKWLPSDDSPPPRPGGYFCPYCGVQAPLDAWLTQAQVRLAEEVVAREVAGPMMEGLARRIGGRFESNVPSQPLQLTEVDDMRRVDPACHPEEPFKVLDTWAGPVYCLLCGQRAATP